MADSKIVLPTDESIRDAAAALSSGELVGVPTETVYGLAADATNQDAVLKIFAAKGRPSNNPLIAHFASAQDAEAWIDVESDFNVRRQWNIATQFWPGPLTVVAPLTGSVAPAVNAGATTLAVRVPDHSVMQSLLREFGKPVAAPSANRSNYVSPTCADHVAAAFGDDLSMVIDGGECRCGVESTIVRLTPTVPQLLRPGGISIEQLQEAFGEIRILGIKSDAASPLPSPGLMRKHYSPHTKLVKVDSFDPSVNQQTRIARIFFSAASDSAASADGSAPFAWSRVLSDSGDLDEVAKNLFAAIRDADQSDCELIVIDVCPLDGVGRAIMDRINRAVTQ
ncbi:threonylcarbamoyl-AMP synthase [Stieleria sp. JC731]|uniref:L-threonylcarbamoyladenylate synthase n=1 Tax=Pirellulaceae TaxID=2691357 RepID=UPI001E527226|nr:L-threonylcarbamoyladenylate synthase [Stieleria sp. JC731]MCC9599419.1 threonylcarbamoyl-AMP synthase [Stieleria sp. JC731]